MLKHLLVITLGLALTQTTWANEVTYRKHIRPLWEAKCSACHGAQSPYLGDFLENQEKYKKALKGPRMDTYADLIFFVGWPDTGALMRRLDDGKNIKGGKPGNMYQHLGQTEEERQKNLALFKAWVGVDAWTHKHWSPKADMPGVTKDELAKIKVKY